MLQDTLERIQARSATKSCRTLYASPYPFGADMQSDKNGKEERLFVISAQPRKTSLFKGGGGGRGGGGGGSQLRSFKGSGKSEFFPASREDPRA